MGTTICPSVHVKDSAGLIKQNAPHLSSSGPERASKIRPLRGWPDSRPSLGSPKLGRRSFPDAAVQSARAFSRHRFARQARSPLFGEPCWPNFHWRPALPRRTINHQRPIPALPVTESVALPPVRGKHRAPTSTPVVCYSIRCDWAPRLSEVQGPDDARNHRADTRQGRRLAYV